MDGVSRLFERRLTNDPPFDLHAADVADSDTRPPPHGGGGGGELLHPLRGSPTGPALAVAGDRAAALRCLFRPDLRLLRSLQAEVTLHRAARSDQHRTP